MRNTRATAAVEPWEADAAWRCLIHKIDGRAGIVGSRMPQVPPFLSAEQIDVIRSWIATGAANN